jgi:hypothetical protein
MTDLDEVEEEEEEEEEEPSVDVGPGGSADEESPLLMSVKSPALMSLPKLSPFDPTSCAMEEERRTRRTRRMRRCVKDGAFISFFAVFFRVGGERRRAREKNDRPLSLFSEFLQSRTMRTRPGQARSGLVW